MEKILGIISEVQITNSDCTIHFTTEDSLTIKNMVKIIFNDKTYYFNIAKIDAVIKENRLFFIGEQTGYYNRLCDKTDLDLRNLLGLEILLVTDEEEKKKIRNESSLL